MRTNIVLDDELIAEALRVTGARTKKDVVHEALRELIRLRRRRSLADLKGRPIMVAKFSQSEFWQFLKQKHGFSDSQLRPYTYSAAPFLADAKAVQQGYVTEDAVLLGKALPKPPVSILLADYGYQNYATTVFGMAAVLEKRKAAVQAFVTAMVKAQDLINASSAQAITDLIYDDYLSSLSKPSVLKAIDLYKNKVWLKDNIITQDAYDRLAAGRDPTGLSRFQRGRASGSVRRVIGLR